MFVRDSAISFSDRIKSGVVGEQLWLQISEPTERDMGKYAIEFNMGNGSLRREVELCGQGENQQPAGPWQMSQDFDLIIHQINCD